MDEAFDRVQVCIVFLVRKNDEIGSYYAIVQCYFDMLLKNDDMLNYFSYLKYFYYCLMILNLILFSISILIIFI